MGKRILVSLFITSLLLAACGSTPPTPTAEPTIELVTPQMLVAPTQPPLPTLTMMPLATSTIFVEPTNTAAPATPIEIHMTSVVDADVPVFPGATEVYYDYIPSPTGEPGDSVYYQVDAELDDIQAFYMEQLVNAGWSWVYTESGYSLMSTAEAPALVMEFRKGAEKLGLAASGFGAGTTIVFAAIGLSGYYQFTGFISGIAGGLDLSGPSRDESRAEAMRFSSLHVEFRHPSNWLARDGFLQIFESDKNVYFVSDSKTCTDAMEPCFVNFGDLTGAHFDIPISLRIHPSMAGLTLEQADALRWEKLNAIVPNKRFYFPEDLTQQGSLEIIEVRSIQLADGTPALQRIYQWNQLDVADPLISTYTLFLSGDMLMEFHTDFTTNEWDSMKSIIEQVIASMEPVP